jgi:predicted phosphodiesterase
MRLLVLSDLHFEFHADAGRAFVDSLDPKGVDVAIVAGDLSNAAGLADALDLVCARFPEVVYVHGNHEFYGSRRASVLATTKAAARRHANLHWLDGDVVELGGRRFVGTPLWYADDPSAPRELMSDFHQIQGFARWLGAENARAVAAIDAHAREGSIVVTHMLPSPRSVAPQYAGSPTNAFFLCDVEHVLRRRAPALWVHGHTHVSCDYHLGPTRVVCNPYGYVRHEENAGFDARKIVRV